MQMKIKKIDSCEALRFLGWKGTSVERSIMEQIETFSSLLINELTPQIAVKAFPLDSGFAAAGTCFCAKGHDVRELLSSCHEIVLLAATLGAQSERLLLREQAVSPASALVLDAVMSAAIEALCDQAQEQLQQRYKQEKLFITDRFSPGYGDMPLEQTREICEVLCADRLIGLTVSASGIMIPRKSVTAIIGVRRTPAAHRASGCAVCSARDRCPNARFK